MAQQEQILDIQCRAGLESCIVCPKHPGGFWGPWSNPTCPWSRSELAIVPSLNSEGPKHWEKLDFRQQHSRPCPYLYSQNLTNWCQWRLCLDKQFLPPLAKLCYYILLSYRKCTLCNNDQEGEPACFPDFLLVRAPDGAWLLGPEGRRHRCRLACLLTHPCYINCQVYVICTKYDVKWFSPFLFQKGFFFVLIYNGCWHTWGEQQHPSYNSFRSRTHCAVTGHSGPSLHFFISLAELQAVQCQKTNYRGIYPILGLVICYSALTKLAWCTECAPLLVGQFSWHCRETCHHFWTNAPC